MKTKDNRHELLTKHNVPQISDNGDQVPRVPVSELDSTPALGTPELEESRDMARGEGALRSADEPRSGDTLSGGQTATTVGSPNEAEDKRLSFLKERIERLREEKERLKRIQELEDLEEATTRQIAGTAGEATIRSPADGDGNGRIGS